MTEQADLDGRIRVAGLNTKRETPFDFRPGSAARTQIADALGLDALRKLRLTGTLAPEGKRGWVLNAMLGATVVQPCVVTLAPVTTRIDDPVTRRFLPDTLIEQSTDAEEIEMPEDDSVEPLTETIDLARVATEALALAIPAYPRAAEADFDGVQIAAPDVAPLTDDDVKPFAGLKSLRDKLAKDD